MFVHVKEKPKPDSHRHIDIVRLTRRHCTHIQAHSQPCILVETWDRLVVRCFVRDRDFMNFGSFNSASVFNAFGSFGFVCTTKELNSARIKQTWRDGCVRIVVSLTRAISSKWWMSIVVELYVLRNVVIEIRRAAANNGMIWQNSDTTRIISLNPRPCARCKLLYLN